LRSGIIDDHFITIFYCRICEKNENRFNEEVGNTDCVSGLFFMLLVARIFNQLANVKICAQSANSTKVAAVSPSVD